MYKMAENKLSVKILEYNLMQDALTLEKACILLRHRVKNLTLLFRGPHTFQDHLIFFCIQENAL